MSNLSDVYDKSLLLSSEIYKTISPRGQAYARKIDNITMNEKRSSLGLYCVDLFPSDPLDDE